MAKDPAFLFYPNDWLGGTMYLSRHIKGCYIDLLIAQFNNGPLSLDTIKTVLGQDQANWTVLSSKFKQTAEGLWYNERLATEIEKRKKFSDSRRDNVRKRYDKEKSTSVDTSVEHMYIHMENRNRDSLPVLEKDSTIRKDRQDFLNNQAWKEQFCMSKNLTMDQLEKIQAQWIEDVDLKGEEVDSYKKYFTNWYNKNPAQSAPKKQMVL